MSTVAPQHFRYQLRPVTLGDGGVLRRWMGDKRLAKGMNLQPRDYSADEMARFILTFNKGANRTAAIVSRESGRMLGVSINALDLPQRVAHFNLMIGEGFPAERDYGQIIVLIFDWLFGLPEVEKIATRMDARRKRAIDLLEGHGLRREGVLVGEVRLPDGRRLDMTAHGLLRDEWRTVRPRVAELAEAPEPLPFGTR